MTLAACSDAPDAGCPTGVVDTTSGQVCGVVLPVEDLPGTSVDAFLGIPFAESTAGANRFQPPVPKARMSGVFAADQLSPACPQMLNPPYGATSISEDCLTVNVWRRRESNRPDARPVLVWIYGGSFTSGANQYPVYQGDYMAAAADVVVVALNYRVGALGFLAGTDGLAGNQGLMDQQLALEWVRDNIDRFGGDPEQVTIFGESAGAMSVGLHELSIPSSAGLFRAALMQSNPLGVPYKSLAQATPIAALFKQKVGCANQGLECLQDVPVDTILTEQGNTELQVQSLLGSRLAGFLVFAPVLDGSFLVGDPTVIANQSGLPLPTLLGTNAADGTIFVAEAAKLVGGTISESQYRLLLGVLFGADNTEEIIALYGVNPSGDNSPNLSNVATDYLFGCPNRYVARRARSDIWVYRFDERSINVWPDVPACDDEACHADDVPFTFHVDRPLGITFTAAQDALSQAMIGYWTSFAGSFDPNGGGRLPWPRFTPDGLDYLLLDTPISTAVNPVQNCDFWDQIGYEIDTPIRFMTAAAEAAAAAAE
ncbi:MAG: carboxylesterase family protein [Thermodesulfobacteriota bacterium]